MPLFNGTEIENLLLKGMDNYAELTFHESRLRKYQKEEPAFQNVHRIKLEENLTVWDNGAWFILKPRFFYQLMNPVIRGTLNTTVSTMLGIEEQISDQSLTALTKITHNDLVFTVFTMLKIMEEKLLQFSPKAPGKSFKSFGDYQTFIHTHIKPSNYEFMLMESLWPGIKDEGRWLEISHQDSESTFGFSIDILKEIIGKITINSSLQFIALNAGLEREGLLDCMPTIGLCDLSSEEFNLIIQGVFDIDANILMQFHLMYGWLTKNSCDTSSSPFTKILSSLLGAILEKPANLEQFLRTLNLQQGLAKDRLKIIQTNQIYCEKIERSWNNLHLRAHESNNENCLSGICALNEEFNKLLPVFRRGEINKKAFVDQVRLSILTNAKDFFADAPSSTALLELWDILFKKQPDNSQLRQALSIYKFCNKTEQAISSLYTNISQSEKVKAHTMYFDAITSLQEEMQALLTQLKNGEINKEVFATTAPKAIQKAQRIFQREPVWYNALINILKEIANFCISLAYDKKNTPQKFFVLERKESKAITEFENDLNTDINSFIN
ncbi:MAG: hypothetical protein QM652_12145 [Legionella sp.]|uniref:hypothetical protein n=1 Tax=Legionella sp. TaxID=459 RepID=UPI0039E3C0EB